MLVILSSDRGGRCPVGEVSDTEGKVAAYSGNIDMLISDSADAHRFTSNGVI
jgi:hypothetical protein